MKRLLLAAAAFVAFASPVLADTLVDNLDGIALDKDGNVDRFTGLVIDRDGKIARVLKRGDKRPAKPDYYVDGKSAVAIPGLIDAHVHVMGIGLGTLTLDLSETKSLAEAQAKVAEWIRKYPDKSWIIGRGWNQERWGLGRFPTAAELDSVTGGKPAFLARVDGHAAWANSAALAAAGVTAATKDPAGGRIERGLGGKPAGVFVDNAVDLVASHVPAPRPEDRDLALRNAEEILLSRGVTAVADMGTSITDWQTYRRAGDVGALTVRIMAYAASIDDMILIGGPGPTPWLYDDRLRLNGLKLYVDGALGSRGAMLKAPYADAPGTRGLAVTEPIKLRNMMSRAAMDKFQIAVHAIGDKANADLLDAIDELSQTYKGDRRWRIEHAQIVDPADIPRFGRNGIVVSMQPVHQTSDRLMAEARLGPARLSGAYAWKSLAATGATLAFGSDAPVEAADPFAGIAAATTRQDENGEPYGGWQPQERISRESALAAYTSGAAYAGFADGRFGRLTPGERADFVLIDRDPLLASPKDLRNIKILQTWVGGRLMWSGSPAR